MPRISIFDMYKIGVGPSSSHTLGPWKAALQFVSELGDKPIAAVAIHLFGSLSKTGVGHGTDIAIMLGLEGYDPTTIDTSKINLLIDRIRKEKYLKIKQHEVQFDPAQEIFFQNHSLDYHPNGMRLKATFQDDTHLEETYFSVGGGFVEQEGKTDHTVEEVELPYPIDRAEELLAYVEKTGLSIAEIVYQNELKFNAGAQIRKKILNIYKTMLGCAYQGIKTSGILPGGLKVTRRAQALANKLLSVAVADTPEAWLAQIKGKSADFATINQWVSCFALAVNEENAAFGRVVTSPTNGAAGVIPAVLLYYTCFCNFKGDEDIVKFFLTSGEIGSIFKKGATISAAQGGCQAEIGVSSAMAAAGLTELLGGTPQQVLMAAEIAMEHHLGLTCDPIGGLVQIPCIERNAMGAMKAITAANLAISGDPSCAIVQLDTVIKTMWDTAQDMNLKYKETSEGGLAINLPVILPNC